MCQVTYSTMFLKQTAKPLDIIYEVLINKKRKFIQINLFELTSKKKHSTSGLEIKMGTLYFFLGKGWIQA